MTVTLLFHPARRICGRPHPPQLASHRRNVDRVPCDFWNAHCGWRVLATYIKQVFCVFAAMSMCDWQCCLDASWRCRGWLIAVDGDDDFNHDTGQVRSCRHLWCCSRCRGGVMGRVVRGERLQAYLGVLRLVGSCEPMEWGYRWINYSPCVTYHKSLEDMSRPASWQDSHIHLHNPHRTWQNPGRQFQRSASISF